ncbi:MAG: FHIPEP family type III secretion protein [Candidatus Saganbacteria bacterium]|nr:FHIPEP family type III secretion protein [Candidatus Saganbacteria bacterium]
MEFLVFYIVFVALIGWWANNLGRNVLGCVICAILLSPLCVGIYLLIVGKSGLAYKKCPKCAEMVKKEAVLCKHCGSSLEETNNTHINTPTNSIPDIAISENSNASSTDKYGPMVAGLLLVIIALLIIPFPPFLIDILMVINLGIALIVFVVSICLKDDFVFISFPSLLLWATVLRGVTNIAVSRMILLNAYAGKVVDYFGNFTIARNYVVGTIIFILIIIVQLVITSKVIKRVAEVAAEARMKKARKTSEFLGVLEGSNKFVIGEAVASIVIILVNIVGGILIGWLQMGMGIMDAVSTYALLAIGCGFVMQISALVMSIATGMKITKSSLETSVGT